MLCSLSGIVNERSRPRKCKLVLACDSGWRTLIQIESLVKSMVNQVFVSSTCIPLITCYSLIWLSLATLRGGTSCVPSCARRPKHHLSVISLRVHPVQDWLKLTLIVPLILLALPQLSTTSLLLRHDHISDRIKYQLPTLFRYTLHHKYLALHRR